MAQQSLAGPSAGAPATPKTNKTKKPKPKCDRLVASYVVRPEGYPKWTFLIKKDAIAMMIANGVIRPDFMSKALSRVMRIAPRQLGLDGVDGKDKVWACIHHSVEVGKCRKEGNYFQSLPGYLQVLQE